MVFLTKEATFRQKSERKGRYEPQTDQWEEHSMFKE